jgi:hypothetical protein
MEVSGFRKVLLAKGCLPFFSQYSSFLKYTYNDDMVLAALGLSAKKKPVPLCNAEAGGNSMVFESFTSSSP